MDRDRSGNTRTGPVTVSWITGTLRGMTTDYVTGIHVDTAPGRGSGGRPVPRRTPHAVPRGHAGEPAVRACCGAELQEVHPDVPFPPGHRPEFSAPACLECQARV